MKKALLMCLALAVTTLMLFVSCNAEVSTPVDTDGLAYVTFGNNTRSASFSVSYDIEDYDELYWTYTATKTDKGGTKGQKTADTYLSVDGNGKPQQGLDYTIGAFSAGEWEFTLKAYKSLITTTGETTTYSLKNEVYTSEGYTITATLRNGETKSVAADVTYAGETGSIRFGSLGGDNDKTDQNDAYFEWSEAGNSTEAPCFRIDAYATTAKKNYVFTNDSNVVKTDSNGYEAVYRLILEKDTSGKTNTKYIIKFVANESTKTYVDTKTDIPADYYSCTVSAYTYNTDGTTTKVAADFTFAFRVYGSATTEITGNMTEDAQSSFKFNVAKLEVQSFTKSTGETTTVESTNSSATAVFSNSDLDESASYVFSRNDQGADSSSEKFVVMTKSGTSAGTEQVAVYGSSSFSLEEIKGNGSKSINNFNNSVTATIPVAAGLDKKNIAVYYSDNGEIDYTRDYFKDYDSGNGLVTIETNHFSTFVVAGKTAAPIYNVTQKRYYSTLQDAVKNLERTSELKLNSDCTVKTDFIVLKNTKLTLDLNGKTLTAGPESTSFSEGSPIGLFKLESDSTLTVKNGTIESTSTNSSKNEDYQAIRIFDTQDEGTKVAASNVNLTLEGVTIDAPCGIVIKEHSKNVTVTVKDSTIYYAEGNFGVTTNAKTDATSENVKITIDGSEIKLRDKTNVQDTTGLLINIPANVVISNSEIEGMRQGAILRGGTYSISGTTFNSRGSETRYHTHDGVATDDYENEDWASGNEVPLAALVIGNRNGSYAYPTTVTFSGTNTLKVGESTVRKQIYIWQAEKASGSETADRSVTVTGFDEIWTANNNFNGAAVTSANENIIYTAGEKSFEKAVPVAESNQTIKLLSDLNFEYEACTCHEFVFESGVVLDLNKHTVTSNNLGVVYEGNVEIKNGKFVCAGDGSYALAFGNDTYENDEQHTATIKNVECTGGINVCRHKLEIETGEFSGATSEAEGTNYYALWVEGNGSRITVNGGNFSSKSTKADTVLAASTESNAKMVINGGTFKTEAGEKQQLFNKDGNFAVQGGTFKGNLCNEKSKKLVITGGTFDSNPTDYVDASQYAIEENSETKTWTVSKSQSSQ